jgi:hypothetical protein
MNRAVASPTTTDHFLVINYDEDVSEVKTSDVRNTPRQFPSSEASFS